MRRIINKFFIGDQNDCSYSEDTRWYVIHACKFPCWQNKKGKNFTNLTLQKLKKKNFQAFILKYPEYLVYEENNNLYLNMIDGRDKYYSFKIFNDPLSDIDEKIKNYNILIHCNEGESRSASLGFLYLVKKKRMISDNGYDNTKKNYIEKYDPIFSPSPGIEIFMRNNWNNF